MDMNLSNLWEIVKASLASCTPWITNSQLWLSNWTTANDFLNVYTHLDSQEYDMKASIAHSKLLLKLDKNFTNNK